MLEGKALFVAVMMLTAAPIAATDQGQAFIGDVTYEIGEVFTGEDEEAEALDKTLEKTDIEDKELLLTDKIVEEDCLTLAQYKELFGERDEILEQRKDKEGARGEDKEDKKSDDKKESDLTKEEWAEKKEVVDEEACLSAEEWALKLESKEDKEEPCFTIDELENKLKDDRKHHKKGWDRTRHDKEKEWDREEKEWYEEEEFRSYLAELSEACDEGNEESCEELREVREELAADRDEEGEEREEEDEERQEEERSRSSDESEGDEAREDEEKEFDEEACLTMEEWKEVIDEDKKEDEDRKDDENRKKQGQHRDAFVREIMEELGNACEEGNEEACVELEEMFAEVEEKEGGCDKERDDEEKDESEDEEEWEEDESEEEEIDEDESEQDESDDEEIEE